jgi:hypothetical protein
LKWLPAFLLFLVLFTGIASAGDEQMINKQLSVGGTVHLQQGIYNIEGPIYIKSDTVLSGEQDTILRVSCPNGRWFSNSISVINGNGNNIEISGFQIDGNVQNLPIEYSHTRSDTAHDCENLIRLQGDSTNFMNNIKVHDLKLYDSFGDGCHIVYCNHAQIYNNFISNCEHEGVFLVGGIDSIISNNTIAGVTSDCLRLDNCVRCEVSKNLCFSYSGNHNNGAYLHGENGLQVANGGVSHGYDARNQPTSTQDINIRDNIFVNNGLKAILLDSVALSESANVIIQNNEFIGQAELIKMGVPFELAAGEMPTKKMSENIFGSIFDILDQDFTFQYLNKETKITASVEITEYKNSYNPHSLIYVSGEGLSSVKYEYNNQSTTHYFTLNEGNQSSNTDLWEGDLSHKGNAVYLEGSLDASKLHVTCFNPSGYNTISNFNITEVNDNSNQILNPKFWAFLGTLTILGISSYRNLRRVIKW